MIGYKLYEKLKKAGYPFKPRLIDVTQIPAKTYTVPTLRELLDACVESGKRNVDIKITISGQSSWWAMVTTTNDINIIPVQTAHTPEEALAKLWLAIHNAKDKS